MSSSAGEREAHLTVELGRSEVGAPRRFVIERTDPMVILDVLLAIQRGHDATIAFRYSCRTATCGTCAIQINGRPGLACATLVEGARPHLELEPLGGLPVVRDLIVDLTPFHDRWARIEPWVDSDAAPSPVRGGAVHPKRTPVDDALLRTAQDCIGCGACFAACGLASDDSPFLGPAALTRLMVLVADPNDGGAARRMAIASLPSGVDGCHSIGACEAVCPKGIDPARAIRQLRRWRFTSAG